MNKLCYRLVFNKIRGVLMAVAETVCNAGKNPGSTSATRHVIGQPATQSMHGRLHSLTFQLWCAWGLVLVSSAASSQIMPDKSAPASQQPIILQAPNNTLLVNIQTPGSAGVSRNTYSQFDVPAQGVILNNARTDMQTQLGGWVAGNPYLATGTARVILNEVNASDPSRLNGYVEVAGSRAQVVIANPAGIACDGCGFINASRATLTTGVAVMNEGNLESYRVQRGSITVSGAGMNAASADYTDLIARSIQINSALWANYLKLTAGSNQVNAAHTQSTPIEGAGAAPAFAIDVAYLGGMYAGKIMLVGSEAGVGVRNAGEIGASVGDVVITAQGRLENAGRITSAGNTQLAARDGIDNSATIYAQGTTALTTQGDIHNAGILAARDDLSLVADGADSRIVSDVHAVLAAGMRVDGSMTDHGMLFASAGKSITANGLNISGGDQYFSAQSLDLTNSRTSAANLNLYAANGDIDASGASLLVSGQLSAESSRTVRTDAASIVAGSVSIMAQDLSNKKGEVVQSGEGALSIELAGVLDNTDGLIAATQNLTISDASRSVKALGITNAGGLMFAGRQLSIDSASLSGDGQLLSQGDLTVTLDADYHHSGTLQAGGNATLQTAGIITNDSNMSAGAGLHLQAAQIHNEAGGQIQGGTVLLEASSAHALINRGLIDGQETRIDSATVKNLGTGRMYGDHVAIAADSLINAAENGTAPVIAARDRLDIGAAHMSNEEHALIFSAGDMAIGGALDSKGQATGQATSLGNLSATIEALGALDIAAAQINNINLHLQTAVQPASSQRITEYAGGGSSNRYLAGTPDVYVYNDETDHLHTPEGEYESWWRYDYDRSIAETTVLHSDPGQILAGGAMHLTADTLVNDNSRIIAGGNLTGAIGSLQNNEATGIRTITDLGSVSNFWRDHQKGRDDTGHRTQSYAPPATIQSISLNTVRYEGNAAPVGSGLQLDGLANPAVNPASNPVTQVTADNGAVVRSGGISNTLANNSLFRAAPDPAAHYLIETDPAFASYRQWLSSDYLLQALAVDPALTQKRLGDGFYEQRLVREQVAQLTGRHFLDGYASDEAQYQALMSNAVTIAESHQLVPGIALTAEQMAALTSDIIWLVEQTVTLPNGETAQVLVPQLYVHVREGDLQGTGALIAGNNVKLELSGDLANSGTIAGRRIVSLSAENVRNLGGQIKGVDVGVSARTDLDNLGGSIQAGNSLTVTAGRDLTVASTVSTQTNAQGSRTNVDRVAGLYVTGNGGTLVAAAGHDLTISGAVVVNMPASADGTADVAGNTVLAAGNNIQFGTVSESSHTQTNWDKNNYRREDSRTEVGSVVQTQGSVQLQAGKDITARGASVNSEQGGVLVMAGRDVSLGTASASRSLDEAQKHKGQSGGMASKTITTHDKVTENSAQATTLSGDTVIVLAGQDITLTGSNAVSTSGTVLVAAGNVSLQAADNSIEESHYRKEKTSGVLGTGGVGFTVGTRTQDIDNQSTRHIASASTVGSTNGDVVIEAGKDYRQTGSDVLAPKGSIDIAAQRVDIEEARNTLEGSTATRFKQTGVTVALSSPVIAAVQTAQQMTAAAGNTKDPRMQTLAAANTGMSVMTAYDSVQVGQGTTIDGKENQIATGTKDNPGSRDSTAADKVGGFTVSISVGTSSSSNKTVYASSSAAESTVNAGHDVHIAATGAGAESDLRIQGSNVKAGNVVILQADDAIALLAAHNTDEQHSKNKSSSASLGVAISSSGGIGVIASGSIGRGHADGNDLTWSNTHIEAGQIAMASGGDTTLQGAVTKAGQVTATVGGDLLIESLQDTTHFDSRQQNASAGVMISTTPTGNVSYSQSQIDSDYASVVEQSGMRAGDAGFNVQVAGDTTLNGGAITSTHTAVAQGSNTFATGGSLTATDIQNKAHYEASSVSVSAGSGVNPAGKLTPAGSSIGLGNDSDSDASTTQAAISGVAGNKDARTGDKETGIAQIFDAGTVQREIDAQTQITQMFGQQVSKAIGDYASKKLEEAGQLRSQAAQTDDLDRREQLLQQADDLDNTWGETGSGRLLAHTVAGGLTAGLGGAAGAAAGTLTAPYVADQLAKAGVDSDLAKAITAAASTTAGALAGGAAGASTAFNEVTNNYLTHEEANRYAALQSKKLRGQCDAACDSELTTLAATDKRRNAQLAACDRIESSVCSTVRQEVRSAAAGYIRANKKFTEVEYSLQRMETEQLALETMDGVRLATLEGYGHTVLDGITALANGLVTGLQALMGDPQARAQVAEGLKKGYAYASDADNAGYLFGAMTPETREQLASAYERGDGKEVGRIMGEQFANMPIGGGVGLGVVKKVSKVVVVAEDAERISFKLKTSPVDTDHVIGGDYSFRTGRVTGGHSLLRDDVRVVEYLSEPDVNGVYRARVEIRTPDGRWVEKTQPDGKLMSNTMFPKDWDEARIQEEIHSAWSRRSEFKDGSDRWTGTSSSGVAIGGYLTPRVTAYPIIKGKNLK